MTDKKRIFLAIFFTALTFIAFYFSQFTSQQFYQTLQLIFRVVIPSLTPFMILIHFVILFNGIDLLGFFLQYVSYPIFKISGYGAIIILTSIFGGFPYSAIMANELLKENKIDQEEAKRIVKYIFFPSLAFMLSTLLNVNLTYQKEFQLITFSVYFTGFLLLFLTRNKKQQKNFLSKEDFLLKFKKEQQNSLTSSFLSIIQNTLSSLIHIAFSILIFSMFKNYLSLLFKNQLLYLISGIFEFSGTSIAILLKPNLQFSYYVILTFILSFSGFSVFFQALPYLKSSNLTLKQMIASRFLVAIISVVIFSILYFFFLL